jgi:hypothetical protein
MPPVTPSRLDRRIAQLGGPSTKTILVAVGDCMRRPDELASPMMASARPEETERALAALSARDVAETLSGVDASSCRGALVRSGEDAFEAAFADTKEDRALFASAALDGLQERDRLASMVVAAQKKLALNKDTDGTAELRSALSALEASLADVDRGKEALSRKLTGINPERRAELGRLAPELRETAWWYSARGEDDALLGVLGGEAVPEGASRAMIADVERSATALAHGAGGRNA